MEPYKLEMGFQHVSYPAFISLRSVFRPLVRLLLPTEYRGLMGQYPTESPLRLSQEVALKRLHRRALGTDNALAV